MDDTHTMLFAISTDTFLMANHPNAILPPKMPGLTFTYRFLPNTSDWYGRWRLAANTRNDYLIDRKVQREESFSGMEGLDVQDAAVQESMGPIVDRSFENLVAADLAVAKIRMRLHDAAVNFREKQVIPPGVDQPDAYNTWSGYIVAPAEDDWLQVFHSNVPNGTTIKARANDTVRYGN
jgi:hypothetical protein